jgi:hypothetical protein
LADKLVVRHSACIRRETSAGSAAGQAAPRLRLSADGYGRTLLLPATFPLALNPRLAAERCQPGPSCRSKPAAIIAGRLVSLLLVVLRISPNAVPQVAKAHHVRRVRLKFPAARTFQDLGHAFSKS